MIAHQTVNTLVVIAAALGVVLTFKAGLNWVRRYLVLHTGNRVDAVLGARCMAGIHATIESPLPEGYQTRVGEHGVGLSEGSGSASPSRVRF